MVLVDRVIGDAALIRSLHCRNLRALEEIRWQLGGGSHLLLGGTGEGKTSLLEAIYLAVTTRSFRTARLGDCLRSPEPGGADSDSFFASVEIEDSVRATLEFGWSRSGGGVRRLNGDRSSLEDHLSIQPILAWSGAEIEVLIGSPDRRRRLIDRVSVALNPGTLSILARYRRALQHKRALLVQPSPQRAAMESFNALLAEAAEALIKRRQRTVELLREALVEVLRDFPRSNFALDLSYRSSPSGPGDTAPPSDPGWALPLFEQVLAGEQVARRPTVGPHRDRMDILFRRRPVAETASAGERKAVGLLLFAAQARLLAHAGRPAVLLIDDVDTEMDQATLETIWPLLEDSPQSVFSSNRRLVFENLEVGSVWRVSEGTIESG